MNFARIASILSGFALFFTGAQCIPLAVALFEAPVAGVDARWGFGAATAVGLVTALLLRQAGRSAGNEFFRRESLTAVALAWLLAGVLGALPFLWSGAVPRTADALFESVSGLTTTGASVLGADSTRAIESLPPSILLWRALLQWLGGLGVVLVFIVLLPAAGVLGKDLLASEQVGVAAEDQRPHMREQARALFVTYSVLTLLAAGGYWLAGMGAYDAVAHALTTLPTGGFSPRNLSIGAYQNLAIELVAILFMFLAGCNLMLLHDAGRRGLRPGVLWRDVEFRGYTWIMGGAVLVVAAVLWLDGRTLADPGLGITRDYSDFARCLRDAAFQVTSVMTETGYCSADFQAWPRTAVLILVLCMLWGGCTGSTAGGLKILRVIVFWKLITYTLRLFIRPKTVDRVKVEERALAASVISAMLALGLMWLLSLAIGTLALALDPRIEFLSAFTASASAMGCCGPAITAVLPAGEAVWSVPPGHLNLGPYGSYGDLDGWAKILLAFQMILGRLEILTPIVLLSPRFWRQ
jgi:trk system potassium uptake protein TrkH